ncbi:MAG: nucleotide exchange factor GrpE [Acidobacteria bacterium]|nr:nucleotide exchange factor GrpE [Acidobacteriota bacterium]
MTQSNMADKGRQKPNRIPVRFDDEGEKPEAGAGDDSGLTPEELGRESSYDDATEMGRRIEGGEAQESGSGESGATGSTDISEQPRSRNDQDTTVSHSDPEGEGGGGASGTSTEPARRADASATPGAPAGPEVAELLATRAELKRVEGELKRLADERQEFNDRLARRQAEFDNFRKRIERERSETYQRALAEVVRRLLPVLDNLQRALDAERVVEVKESAEFRHFLEGVELINRQLGGVLESLGVEAVPTVGELFDPHVHEAVATEETDGVEPDTITQEMQRGYRLGDKLLRPAMVKVATRG